MDWAKETNKMFIVYGCVDYSSFETFGNRELKVCTATYGPGIDQS